MGYHFLPTLLFLTLLRTMKRLLCFRDFSPLQSELLIKTIKIHLRISNKNVLQPTTFGKNNAVGLLAFKTARIIRLKRDLDEKMKTSKTSDRSCFRFSHKFLCQLRVFLL